MPSTSEASSTKPTWQKFSGLRQKGQKGKKPGGPACSAFVRQNSRTSAKSSRRLSPCSDADSGLVLRCRSPDLDDGSLPFVKLWSLLLSCTGMCLGSFHDSYVSGIHVGEVAVGAGVSVLAVPSQEVDARPAADLPPIKATGQSHTQSDASQSALNQSVPKAFRPFRPPGDPSCRGSAAAQQHADRANCCEGFLSIRIRLSRM